MRKKLLFLIIFFSLAGFALLILVQGASAAPTPTPTPTPTPIGCVPTPGTVGCLSDIELIKDTTLQKAIGRIVLIFIGAAAAFALAFIIYGGLILLTSAGSDRAKKGKDIISWSIIGLVLMLIGYTVIAYIIGVAPLGSGGIPPLPPPTVPPPPSATPTTKCVGDAAVYKPDPSKPETCCAKISYAGGCTEQWVSGYFSCCDCGKTKDTLDTAGNPMVCKKGSSSAIKDNVPGHCGSDAWWCAPKASDPVYP